MSEADILVGPYENIPEVSNLCHPLLLIDILPFNAQDLICNVTTENLVLDQLKIP